MISHFRNDNRLLIWSNWKREGSENARRTATWGRWETIQKEEGEEMRRRGGRGCHGM
jgi:hypothetical protein